LRSDFYVIYSKERYFLFRYPGVIVMPALSQPDLHAGIKHCIIAVVNTSASEGMAACILEVRNFFIYSEKIQYTDKTR
jgi:hypothetical protein